MTRSDVNHDAIPDAQPALDKVCSMVGAAAKATAHEPPSGPRSLASPLISAARLADDDVLRHLHARPGSARLWAGDTAAHGGDDSAADLALCNNLAFYCGDPVQMDRLFRRSGLYRPKWDEHHGTQTYGQMTLTKALEGRTDFYQRGKAPAGPASPTDAQGGEPAMLRIVQHGDPLPLAQNFADACYRDPQGRLLLRRWRDACYRYDGACYRPMSEDELNSMLYPHLAALWTPVRGREGQEVHDSATGQRKLKKMVPTTRLAGEVRSALVAVPGLLVPDRHQAPCWLDAVEGADPRQLLLCRNGVLDLSSEQLTPHTPALFNLHALEFDYDPQASTEPTAWSRFLHQLFGDDFAAVCTLQEWFGYCLTPDTRQQKMLMLVGPKRSGKGTIMRILAALLGHANVAGPTLASLGSHFGLQPLQDKLLAVISDARLGGRSDPAVVVERLLTISGEDHLTVDTKYKTPRTVKLPTRIVLASNELPRWSDASCALASRFIVLELRQSFVGKEDPNLADHLLEELPGILNWAILGWKRLHARGCFQPPESSAEVVREMEDLSSPVRAFIRERCEIAPGKAIAIERLYAAYRAHCEEQGLKHPSSVQVFGRDFRAATSDLGVDTQYVRQGKNRVRIYRGIDLCSPP